jgi:hypothetical protein
MFTTTIEDHREADMVATFGDSWFERSEHGERFLSEGDFALDTHEADMVSESDWDAYFEMTFVDPAERAA